MSLRGERARAGGQRGGEKARNSAWEDWTEMTGAGSAGEASEVGTSVSMSVVTARSVETAPKHPTGSRSSGARSPVPRSEDRGLQRESALTGLLGLAQEGAAGLFTPRSSPGSGLQSASGANGGVGGSDQAATLVDRSGVGPSHKERLERNRTAAQQCRKRKKEYVRGIEDEVTKLRASNLLLQSAVATASAENQLLRRENEMYRRIVQNRGNVPARETALPAPKDAASVIADSPGAWAGAQAAATSTAARRPGPACDLAQFAQVKAEERSSSLLSETKVVYEYTT